MPLNNLPLLSVSTVKAALEQINASHSATAAKPADALPASVQGLTVAVEAKVVAVQVQGQQVLLSLASGDQQFQVQSDLPLPVGTKLTLQVTTYPQESGAETKPEVLVQKIILPENKTTPPTQALIQRFISERLALLDASLQAESGLKASDSKSFNSGDTYLRPGVSTGAQGSNQSNAQASIQANTHLNSNTQSTVQSSGPNPTSATNNQAELTSTSSAVRVSELISVLSLLQASNPLSKSLPADVQQVLKQWQQSLPSMQQLAQVEAVKASIQQSGVQYEKRVMELLEKIQANPQTEPKALFKALWAKAGAVVSPLNSSLAESLGNSTERTAGNSISSAFSNRLEQILKAVHTALEQPVPLSTDKHAVEKLVSEKLTAEQLDAKAATPEKLAADKASLTPPSLLQALLGSNHKAVISRALLAWAQTLAERPGQTGQSSSSASAARSLPLTPFPNGPEAFQLLQRALAHIEHEQVRQLQPNEPWQLSVPLLFKEGGHHQEVRLELYKDDEQGSDKNDGEAKETLWRLRLFFDLQNLGSLDADIELRFPNVKVTFWSKQQETLNSLSQTLKPLQQKLTALGAEVEDIQVKFGQLPEKSRNLINQRLVDAKA